MKKRLTNAAEIILGLSLLLLGVDGFLGILPKPAFNAAGSSFISALSASGYIFPLMHLVWIVAGVMFLIRKNRPFALLLFVPFVVNMFLFHLFLDSTGAYFAHILLVITIYLIWAYWDIYRKLFG